MKVKKVASLLLASMIVVTNVFGSTTAILAQDKADFEITANNFETQDLVKYANPLIGTNNFKGDSEWAGTAPLVTTPFGMTNFTPQTRINRIGDISYMYRDTKFKGFLATHQPAIWMGDYGYVNVMPQIGDVKPDENSRALTFSHDDEISTPYYYKVKAGKDEGKPITAEMSATERCAIYNFTYPKSEASKFFVESARNRGNGEITIDTENGEIYGWNNDNMSSHLNNNPPKNLKGYFVIKFSKSLNDKGTYENYQVANDKVTAKGKNSGAYVTFSTEENETVEVKIGTSFHSVDQARANIEQEVGNKSFNDVVESTKKLWNDKLNTIQIEGATESENKIFYTAMYHALLYPRSFYENIDGKDMYFSPYDDKYHEGRSYTDFSLWDTFRAQNSLLTIVAPERIDDMINSLLQTYKEGGYMPKWPNPGYSNIMIGTHADSLVAEAINKGFDGFDYNLAYDAVLKDAMVPQEGDGKIKWGDRQQNVPYEARGGLSAYKALGYIPNGYVNENVSRTIEFSYDDWCVAQVAKKVGKEDEAKYFLNRSMNYKNAINPDTGYAMGRDIDGNWTTSGEQFTEGDRRKYTWFAPQDPQGLLDYMTEHQDENFYNNELEKAFGGQGGNKWIEHQNEPCHNYAYMFDYSGRPDLTQKYARQTLLESYTDDTNGELGNDDCGQMSSWYVFSAMGFYPANPASGEYMIGSPIFDKVTINNPKTKQQFIITANNNNDLENKNCYITDATLNGKELNVPYLTYDQITAGGNVTFNMSDTPSNWANDYRKEAIKYDETAQSPEDDGKPPFFGDSKVTRVLGEGNLAKDASVSATDYADANGDIDVPSKSLIDGNYDVGYASKNIKSNADLAKAPYYLTVEWQAPKERVTSFKMWSNYSGNQNPTKMDIEVKDKDSGNEWKTVVTDWAPTWKEESGGDHRCSANITFDEELKDITGLRVRIKEANFTWGKVAIRELEVFEDVSEMISVTNPTDYLANIKYNGNELEKVLFNGTELKENVDYELLNDKKQIKVFGQALVQDGADSGAKLEFIFSQGNPYLETLVIWNNWKSNLESQVQKGEAADNATYLYSSLEKLAPVLQEAKEVLKNQNATENDFEKISIKLQEALKNLVAIDKSIEVYQDSLMNIPGIIAKVNNQVNDREGAYQAIDFNKNTKWSCRTNAVDQDGNFWLEVKMPEKYVVEGMGLLSAGNENLAFITEKFSLQVKADGEWKDVLTVTDNTDNSYRGELPENVVGDEFRLLIPKLSDADANNARILEFHLYGAKAANKDFLQETYDSYKDTDSNQYTPKTWEEFAEALLNAKNVLADEIASQEEVDTAVNKLNEAVAKLVKKANKRNLQIAIEEADKITAAELDDVVDTVAKEFKAALKEAKEILVDENATQDIVNNSFERLANIMQYLSFTKGDKTDLQNLVNKINDLNKDEYLAKGWDAMEPLLAKAIKVLDDGNAMQEEVTKVHDELLKGFLGLRLKPNKDLLEDLINQAQGLNKAMYTPETWSQLEKSLAKVTAVFTNEQATADEVAKAETLLKDAIANLVKVDGANENINISKDNNTLNDKNSAAKTGDTTNLSSLAVVAIMAGLGTIIVKRKKED